MQTFTGLSQVSSNDKIFHQQPSDAHTGYLKVRLMFYEIADQMWRCLIDDVRSRLDFEDKF